jgi:hypothetical protein
MLAVKFQEKKFFRICLKNVAKCPHFMTAEETEMATCVSHSHHLFCKRSVRKGHLKSDGIVWIAVETNYFNIFFSQAWGESSKTSIRLWKGDLKKSQSGKRRWRKNVEYYHTFFIGSRGYKNSLKFDSNNLLRLFPLKWDSVSY